MFTPLQQRLVKETLLYIYQKHPEMMELPIWFLPFNDKRESDLVETLRAFHGFAPLPWPDNNCIIIAEDPWSSLLNIPGRHHLVSFIHLQKNDEAYTKHMHDAWGDRADIVSAAHDIKLVRTVYLDGKIHIDHAPIFMENIEVHHSNINRDQESYKKNAELLIKQLHIIDPDLRAKVYARMYKNLEISGRASGGSRMLKTAWTVRTPDNPYLQQMGLANDILEALSNIMTPCAYAVKSRFSEGFGTSSIKRQVKDKPIFSFISFDRLYRSVVGGEYTGEMSPHFRRGHPRHLWKEAGVDRNKLPVTPSERLRLVREKRVRRIYIPPTWVGDPNISIDGVDHEILTGEIPLANL